MFGLKRYNYDRFTKDLLAKDTLMDNIGGPEPGERAPEFSAHTVDGEKISLRDYIGEKNVVLSFGSATCPFTAASIAGMNELYDEYNGDEVQFLFCYVREAHPGERLPSHENFEDKLHAAELFRQQEDVQMPVLVDEVRGAIHRKYGKLPNSTYIIDKSGRVAFRSLWTRPSVIEEALVDLLERQSERDVEHAVVLGGEDSTMPTANATLHTYRALRRGGRRAITEFQQEMGMPGRLAVTASRVASPVADHPAKAILYSGATVGVIMGGVFLGRFLRERRFHTRTPYDIESMGVPKPSAMGREDYAVGI